MLERHGLIASMSARGNCYDNAAMEIWNHSLKVEAIHGERFATRTQAKAHMFEYIEVDYSGMTTPEGLQKDLPKYCSTNRFRPPLLGSYHRECLCDERRI